jgi:putative transposase
MKIITLFGCFAPQVTAVSRHRLAVIAQAVLTMTGRITMLGMSRWSEKGGSYRSIQRFFATELPWEQMQVKFFATHLFKPEREYILAGDETVIGKSGRETYGVNRFFSGLRGKVIRGLSFFVFSLVDTVERKSYPLLVEQRIKSEVEKKEPAPPKKKGPAKRGRPAGSRNRDKREFKPSSELQQINAMLKVLLGLLRPFVPVKYLALDGHFGHHQAVLLAQQNELELISKLRRDTVLYEPYDGEQSGKGRKKKYGARLKYDSLPTKYLQKSEQKGDEIINYYAGVFWHQEFAEAMRVVVIVRRQVKKKKEGHAILFSSEVGLAWEKLLDYYSLRFQIEFNFRDVKQHFGLEDFMNTKAVGVTNAANLAFLMVLLSAKLQTDSAEGVMGIHDLKTQYRGAKYAVTVIKKVLKNPEPILMQRIIEEVGRLGSIYRTTSVSSSP